MTLMATQTEHDARGAARILAETARMCIDHPEIAADREVALNNVYRLLEAFRTNAFFGVKSSARNCSYAPSETGKFLDPDTHVGEVRSAMETACMRVFMGSSRDQALDTIENVLRFVAYPEKFSKPAEPEYTAAIKFFGVFSEELMGQLSA